MELLKLKTAKDLTVLQLAKIYRYADKFMEFIKVIRVEYARNEEEGKLEEQSEECSLEEIIGKAIISDKVIEDLGEDTIIPYKQLFGDSNESLTLMDRGAKIVGEGGYGAVYQYLPSEWGYDVAIKELRPFNEIERITKEKEFIKEARIMVQLPKHPNVVRLIGVSNRLSNNQYYMIMEFLPNGSLKKLLLSDAPELGNWQIKRKICLDIARGIDFLHRKGVFHCDLKSDNVLMSEDHSVKLADFGISKIFAEEKGKDTVPPGTITHIAPELLTNDIPEYEKSCDIYSYGVTPWEIIMRLEPYAEHKGPSLREDRAMGYTKIETIGSNLRLIHLASGVHDISEIDKKEALSNETPILIKHNDEDYSLYCAGMRVLNEAKNPESPEELENTEALNSVIKKIELELKVIDGFEGLEGGKISPVKILEKDIFKGLVAQLNGRGICNISDLIFIDATWI